MSRSSKSQGFEIVGADYHNSPEQVGEEIDACFSFNYKGYLISASTAGYSENGMLNPVVIWVNDNQIVTEIKGGDNQIQQAIEYIDSIV